jgi:hypothetical protein
VIVESPSAFRLGFMSTAAASVPAVSVIKASQTIHEGVGTMANQIVRYTTMRVALIAFAFCLSVSFAACSTGPTTSDAVPTAVVAGPVGSIVQREALLGAPDGAAAYRILYRSTGLNNEPISLTMITRKLDIIASRAEDSQQTLVTVPVIITVSKPQARSRSGSVEAPGRKALKRYFFEGLRA